MGATSQEVLMNLIRSMFSNITPLKELSHLPSVNELICRSQDVAAVSRHIIELLQISLIFFPGSVTVMLSKG